MGDSRRFDLFSNVIKSNFPPHLYSSVADIAGGKGYLQRALREKGYKNVVTFDKRKKHIRFRGVNFRYGYFDERIEDEFNLLVAMHPDEATDVTIVEASKRNLPFVICPCCVRPRAKMYNGPHKYNAWMKHLKSFAESLGYEVTETRLKMGGKNVVLIGRYRNGTTV